jgi:hypothetical protein
MGTGAAVHGEVGAFTPAAGSSRVRWRWLALIVAVVVPFAAAYVIGGATKSKSTSAQTAGALSPAVSLAAPRASVTALHAGVSVPGLKAAPKRPKRKPASTAASSSTSPATGVTPPTGTTASSGVVASPAPVASAPVQSSTPPATSTPPSSSTPSTGVSHSSSGSSSSGGSSGVTHGGG